MEGVLRFQGSRHYFVLWRRSLYQWDNRPAIRDFSTAKTYLLSKLQNLETDPSQRHVLILKFPQERIELAANNPGSYQAWLSCFAVFHVRNSLDRKAPYLVSSIYMKAIWCLLDDIHWRGCLTENIFLSKGNENSVEMLRLELLRKGPGVVDPHDYCQTTVASVAKVLLDSLPESLWTEKALSEFKNYVDIESLRNVITMLPEQNFEVLKKLFITLSSVATNVVKSKMTVDDLARVISPILDSRERTVGLNLRKITMLCISEYQQLFIGAPNLIVIVPKIEDILTYKRMDFCTRKKKEKWSVFHSRKEYRNERMPRKAEIVSAERKLSSGSSTSLLFISSDDDESSDSHSHRRLKHLRPPFGTSELSLKYPSSKRSCRANSMVLTDLPETEPVPDMSTHFASNRSLALAFDDDLDEKSCDNEDSSEVFLHTGRIKHPHRGRSRSVVLNDSIAAETSNTQYSCRNILNVVGKRRAGNTRLVKSLQTDSFFVYSYLCDDDHLLTIDGLFPTKKGHFTHRRIQVPIAEHEEREEYQKALIKQNKETEFLEVFGPSQSCVTTPRSLLHKKFSLK